MLKSTQYGYWVKTCTILLFFWGMLSGCSQRLMQTTAAHKEVEVGVEVVLDEYHEFVSVGYSVVSAQKGDSDDIKMLNAIKASKIDAYKELAEQVYGVMLTSENSVDKHQLQDEKLDVKVVGLVRGAKVLRTYHEGDLYITELGLKMKTLPNTDYADLSSTETGIHVQPQIYY